MLKKILIGLAIVIVLGVVGIAALVMLAPTDFRVEREITINKPKDEVFAYAKMLKNQNEWGPWAKRDPAIALEFRGTDGTPGFTNIWKSQNPEVGEGEQEIKNIVDGERIDSQIRFKVPFESTADAAIITESIAPEQTRVKWSFAGSMPRPMNLFMLAVDMDSAGGKDFDDGLSSMKTILEK